MIFHPIILDWMTVYFYLFYMHMKEQTGSHLEALALFAWRVIYSCWEITSLVKILLNHIIFETAENKKKDYP